jgi:broad specificity phosphatase PhoE
MRSAVQDETVALLVRHGHTDAIGHRLVGRLPGIGLTASGHAQAAALAARLAECPIAAVYSGPLERAVETARPVAAAHGLNVSCLDGLNECDFGEWTGSTFDELNGLDAWRRFNLHRSTAAVPGGETALDVQRRVVCILEELRSKHPGEVIVLVSHMDVIRTAVLHCAGTSLDLFDRFDIAPASISSLSLGAGSWRVLATNDNATPPQCLRFRRQPGETLAK